MKKAIFSIIITLASFSGFAQGGVGIGTETPSAKSILELNSTNKGFLLPRMTTAQRTAISPTATTDKGMQVFDTTTNTLWFWNGTAWVEQKDTNTTYSGSTSVALNGTSFERAALTGDVTAAANSNATTISNNAVTSAKIANGTILGADFNQMSATIGEVLKWNGTAWAPAADTDVNTTYSSSTSVNLNGTSFERAALTGDVTAAANSNATTISNNAVNSAKIADGTIVAADLNQMSATSGQVLKWDGTAWAPATDANTTYSGSTSITLSGTSFQRAALTGDVTAPANSNATTIAADAVTSAKILNATIANADLATGVGGIYKGSGSLSGDTTATLAANDLIFNSTTGNFIFNPSSTGKMALGNTAPIADLDLRTTPSSTTNPGAGSLSVGTTTLGAAAAGAGAVRYNTTSGGILQYSNGTAWNTLESNVQKCLVVATKWITTQSIPVNAVTLINNWTEVEDNSNAFNPTNGRFTAPRNGVYTISGTLALQPATNFIGWVEILIRVRDSGGTITDYYKSSVTCNSDGGVNVLPGPGVSINIPLTTGESVDLTVYNSTGQARSLMYNSGSTPANEGFNNFSVIEN